MTGSWWTDPALQQDHAKFYREVEAHAPQISAGRFGQFAGSPTLGTLRAGPRLTRAQRRKRDKERAG
ncbi:MAG TPA: hypothetical protein VG538_06235 [Vicinamibacterales bacterium]|nr:hypothetical protein [Vicinamibacterales bacterium]